MLNAYLICVYLHTERTLHGLSDDSADAKSCLSSPLALHGAPVNELFCELMAVVMTGKKAGLPHSDTQCGALKSIQSDREGCQAHVR